MSEGFTVDPFTLDDLIPFFETVDENGNTIDSDRLVAAEDFYQPDDPEGGSIIALITFDMNNADEPFRSVGLIADAHLIYASTESLYTGATLRSIHGNRDPIPSMDCMSIV